MSELMFEDVTTRAITHANHLLNFLVEKADPDWEKVFNSVLTPTEMELNRRNITLALQRLGKDAPVGAVVGGTGLAKAEAGLAGEDSQRAVRLLKQTLRLLQAGKGRGRALLVLDNTALAKTDFIEAIDRVGINDPGTGLAHPSVPLPDDAVSRTDISGMARAIHSAHRDLQQRHDDVLRALGEAHQRVAELEAALEQERKARGLASWS